MSFHIEVLDEAQQGILPRLGVFAAAQGFYLAGGTAVALHLGHRKSLDFDWFLRGELGDALDLAERARSSDLALEAVRVAPRTLHASVANVRISFFAYPYELLTPSIMWEDYGFQVASLDDLACMKLAAIAQRGSRKDFVDVYAIAASHRPFQELLALYQRKYSITDIGHVLAGMTYFDDAEDEPSPVMLLEVPWDEVRRQFRQWAVSIAG